MKKIIKYIFKKIYSVGRNAYRLDLKKRREIFLQNNAVIGENFYFGPEARIQNLSGDKEKISIGKNTSVHGYLMLSRHAEELIIGENCFIGQDTKIWSAKKIQIGNRVLIAHNVNIHDNISHPVDAHERHLDYLHIREHGFQNNASLNEKEVIIGDDVWIGFNSTILKGVTIGNAAIIGACTVITRDIPANAVVIGNPAKIIRYTPNQNDHH